jgi:cytochrome c-type biogenesis protein CcmH/NrfG
MKKEALLLVIVAFIAGVLVGVIACNLGENRDNAEGPSASVAAPSVVDQRQQISQLQEILSAEPDNRNAWVQLGHKYFDAEQPMEAIDAYDKALGFDGMDPDVLTDQGIMFRQVGWYDRAIANFEKANSLNSNHQQSLYNLGIVYRYDLQDFAKAITVWSRYVELNPSGQGVDQIRAELEFMKTHRQPQPTAEQAPQSE